MGVFEVWLPSPCKSISPHKKPNFTSNKIWNRRSIWTWNSTENVNTIRQKFRSLGEPVYLAIGCKIMGLALSLRFSFSLLSVNFSYPNWTAGSENVTRDLLNTSCWSWHVTTSWKSLDSVCIISIYSDLAIELLALESLNSENWIEYMSKRNLD